MIHRTPNNAIFAKPPDQSARGVWGEATKSNLSLLKYSTLLLLTFFCYIQTFAGTSPEGDEVAVSINVLAIGNTEVPAFITNDNVYLSISSVFDFLKIHNVVSPGLDSVTGFFINPQAKFLVDKNNNRIVYQQKNIGLDVNGLIKTETGLYLRADYFGTVFGLDCKFYFRSLSVTLTTSIELPAIREMRLAMMRNNINRLNGQERVDTTIKTTYAAFRGGMADWSAISTQTTGGSTENRLGIALGSAMAGGDLTAALTYDNFIRFREREQYYQWHFVNNDNNALRQVMAGKMFVQSVSSIYAPVLGLQFTNAPTGYRRSFGTYTLSNYTTPGWTVELYVNDVLVNYVVADASGFFTFQVPLVYGNSAVKLRFYGLNGEEHSSEQNILIPFNFLPAKQFEYIVTGGMVEDTIGSRFVRASFNYGLTKRFTIGGGVEYLSSVTSGRPMPFVKASFRATNNLLIAGEYTYDIEAKLSASYSLPNSLQVDVSYTHYTLGQTAINNTLSQERKATVAFPFHTKKIAAFTRLSAYQIVLPSSFVPGEKVLMQNFTTLQALLSCMVGGVNINLTTNALLAKPAAPYVYTNVGMAFRLPAKLTLMPQLQYQYSPVLVTDVKCMLGKYINANGFLNMFYEDNMQGHFTSAGIELRYNFSFAQMGFSATRTGGSNSIVESAAGSLLYDDKNKRLAVSNRPSVGRGGITIVPFLDLNNNGRHDADEPRVEGLVVQVNGGITKYYRTDTAFRIANLEPYVDYTLTINNNFENVSWQIKKHTLKVAAEPDLFKMVEIPVTVMGEVSGTVYMQDSSGKHGQGRLSICYYRADNTLAAKVLSEDDGTFDYTGLPPGQYTACVDAGQLKQLHLTAIPACIPFTIKTSVDGDVVGGLALAVGR